jgi:hypothetical protein
MVIFPLLFAVRFSMSGAFLAKRRQRAQSLSMQTGMD